MMKVRGIFVTGLILLLGLSSCKYGASNPLYKWYDVDDRANQLLTITDTAANEVTGKYSVVILTDTHEGSETAGQTDAAFFEWLEAQDEVGELPKFCLVLGDVSDGGDREQLLQYKAFTDKLSDTYGIQTFTTCGNHDMYHYSWEDWQEIVYPYTSFFKIPAANVSFYSLDTATGTIGRNQMHQLEKAFAADPNPKFVISHYPLYTQTNFLALEDTIERNELLQLFADNQVKMYFAGHFHIYEELNFTHFTTYTVPSFRDSNSWGLLKIDESSADYSFEIICTSAP